LGRRDKEQESGWASPKATMQIRSTWPGAQGIQQPLTEIMMVVMEITMMTVVTLSKPFSTRSFLVLQAKYVCNLL
jgi:hypothetical protein